MQTIPTVACQCNSSVSRERARTFNAWLFVFCHTGGERLHAQPPHFSSPVIKDPFVAAGLFSFLEALDLSDVTLEREARLYSVLVHMISRHADRGGVPGRGKRRIGSGEGVVGISRRAFYGERNPPSAPRHRKPEQVSSSARLSCRRGASSPRLCDPETGRSCPPPPLPRSSHRRRQLGGGLCRPESLHPVLWNNPRLYPRPLPPQQSSTRHPSPLALTLPLDSQRSRCTLPGEVLNLMIHLYRPRLRRYPRHRQQRGVSLQGRHAGRPLARSLHGSPEAAARDRGWRRLLRIPGRQHARRPRGHPGPRRRVPHPAKLFGLRHHGALAPSRATSVPSPPVIPLTFSGTTT